MSAGFSCSNGHNFGYSVLTSVFLFEVSRKPDDRRHVLPISVEDLLLML